MLTHAEPINEKLGYQPESAFFMEKSMETLARMLGILDSVKEGKARYLITC